MRIKLQKTKMIKGITYRLSLITEHNYFYSNYSDPDERTNTLLYNKKTDELVSEHFSVLDILEKELETKTYLWASKFLINCYNKYNEIYNK